MKIIFASYFPWENSNKGGFEKYGNCMFQENKNKQVFGVQYSSSCSIFWCGKNEKKRNTGCQIYIPLNNVGKSAENERCTGCSFLKTKVKGSYAETLYFWPHDGKAKMFSEV